MLTIIKVLIAVYIVAINVYAFLLMHIQKRQSTEAITTVKDGRIFIVALLGGALAIYVSTFILRYRRDSMLIMVLMPMIATVNAFIFVTALTYDYGYGLQTPMLFHSLGKIL